MLFLGSLAIYIEQYLVDPSKYDIKAPYDMVPKYITVHNTADDLSAYNEIANMELNDREVSWHLGVDDKHVVQGIPFSRNSWHAGDGGSGTGNRESISIEICYSKSGGPRFYKAEENAVQLVAQLMKNYSIPISNVVQHYNWSQKNCPQKIREEHRWNEFLTRVMNVYESEEFDYMGPTRPYMRSHAQSYFIGNLEGKYMKYVRMLMDDAVYKAMDFGEQIGSFKAGNVVKVKWIHTSDAPGYAGYIFGEVSYQGQTGYVELSHTRPVADNELQNVL